MTAENTIKLSDFNFNLVKAYVTYYGQQRPFAVNVQWVVEHPGEVGVIQEYTDFDGKLKARKLGETSKRYNIVVDDKFNLQFAEHRGAVGENDTELEAFVNERGDVWYRIAGSDTPVPAGLRAANYEDLREIRRLVNRRLARINGSNYSLSHNNSPVVCFPLEHEDGHTSRVFRYIKDPNAEYDPPLDVTNYLSDPSKENFINFIYLISQPFCYVGDYEVDDDNYLFQSEITKNYKKLLPKEFEQCKMFDNQY
jgi:hypothetical protein